MTQRSVDNAAQASSSDTNRALDSMQGAAAATKSFAGVSNSVTSPLQDISPSIARRAGTLPAQSFPHRHQNGGSNDNDDTGELFAWGSSSYGRLGLLTVPAAHDMQQLGAAGIVSVPERVQGSLLGAEVTGASGGWYHSCACTKNGTVLTFGTNVTSCLGHSINDKDWNADRDTESASTKRHPRSKLNETLLFSVEDSATDESSSDMDETPWAVRGGRLPPRKVVAFPTRVRIVQVAASGDMGGAHTLALTDRGKVYAWGYAPACGIGVVDGNVVNTPALVEKLMHRVVTSVGAGGGFSAALTAEGSVWTWGHRTGGRLGYRPSGSALIQPRPREVEIPAGDSISSIACGNAHVLACSARGRLWTWGDNSKGQLGLGHLNDQFTPDSVSSSSSVSFVGVACGGHHSMAFDHSGKLWTWGGAGGPCLGLGARVADSVQPLSGSSSDENSIAMDVRPNRDAALCISFQLRRTGFWWSRPLQVKSLADFRVSGASAGAAHSAVTCLMTASDAEQSPLLVFVWGPGGQSGLGTDSEPVCVPRLLSPSDHAPLLRFSKLCCGGWHSLGIGKTGHSAISNLLYQGLLFSSGPFESSELALTLGRHKTVKGIDRWIRTSDGRVLGVSSAFLKGRLVDSGGFSEIFEPQLLTEFDIDAVGEGTTDDKDVCDLEDIAAAFYKQKRQPRLRENSAPKEAQRMKGRPSYAPAPQSFSLDEEDSRIDRLVDILAAGEGSDQQAEAESRRPTLLAQQQNSEPSSPFKLSDIPTALRFDLLQPQVVFSLLYFLLTDELPTSVVGRVSAATPLGAKDSDLKGLRRCAQSLGLTRLSALVEQVMVDRRATSEFPALYVPVRDGLSRVMETLFADCMAHQQHSQQETHAHLGSADTRVICGHPLSSESWASFLNEDYVCDYHLYAHVFVLEGSCHVSPLIRTLPSVASSDICYQIDLQDHPVDLVCVALAFIYTERFISELLPNAQTASDSALDFWNALARVGAALGSESLQFVCQDRLIAIAHQDWLAVLISSAAAFRGALSAPLVVESCISIGCHSLKPLLVAAMLKNDGSFEDEAVLSSSGDVSVFAQQQQQSRLARTRVVSRKVEQLLLSKPGMPLGLRGLKRSFPAHFAELCGRLVDMVEGAQYTKRMLAGYLTYLDGLGAQAGSVAGSPSETIKLRIRNGPSVWHASRDLAIFVFVCLAAALALKWSPFHEYVYAYLMSL